MNFHYSTHTTHRPQRNSSHFNEDAHCDNEVNLILEKNYNQQFIEQSIHKEEQQSAVGNQTDQYYFMPIREQSSTMALPANNNSNVPDSSSILLSDLNNPSKQNLFDYSITTLTDSTTVNKSNDNYNLTDADLAALFVSSIVSTTPSNTTNDNKNEHSNNNNNNTLDDVFIQQVNDLVCSSQPKPLGPPPGFENFRFDTSSSSDNSINTAAIQPTQVSSSDTINFSQLLQSNIVDTQQQQLIGGNVRSSSSSHSSFTSDEQSIFFPMSTHPYSSSSSQIFSTTTPALSTTTITNSNAKPFLPNSLSINKKTFSSLDTSNTTSPISTKLIDADTIIKDGDTTPSHIFASPNSFFSNGHKDFAPTKPSTTKLSSTNRQSSSSASSSTSSSIDDALIQLSQQQQQTVNKLFPNESLSIFNFPSSQSTTTNIDKQQRAVHENIHFLASMAAASTPVTPESPWQQTTLHSNINLPRKMPSMILQQQTILPQSPGRNPSINMQEFVDNLNEICYRGFDELNALIQEQRWVQNYLNMNSSSPNSPLVNTNGTNCCSSRILIVPEYFIFKCKKIEITASHVYELLATGRPELRLRDLMFVFKSWKESITNAELIHQEEEMKLRLSIEHPHSYYMNETVLQAAFDRVSYAIRQLSNMTQQARAAFQYATLNVFQMSSRQQNQPSSNLSQSSNALALAQLQAMQQHKSSSSIHRIGGSIHTTP
jgi:hypothetical protein